MKKNLFKKSVSMFLTVLMLLSCWVWMPGMEEHNHAEAVSGTVYGIPAINGSHYNAGTTAAYGTPVFDGNTDRWFKWYNNNDYFKVYYPSHIYLDKTETLQYAGYYWKTEAVFGGNTNYRTLLGANVWGDHSQWSGYPDRYYTMNNIFPDYAVDASLPQGTNSNGGVYGRTSSSSNFDLRIVGYGYSDQGSDQFSRNNITHTKYVLFRSRQATDRATIYLKGTPSASYVGKTSEYNTSGSSFGSYGYCQNYGNSWGTDTASAMFEKKNAGAATDGSSSYYEGQWGEMQWFITIYDKSALNTLINNAVNRINDTTTYARTYREKLSAAVATARAVLTKRATNQTEIDNAKAALQTVYNATETRTYELTFENLFSLSDWWNSSSAVDGTYRDVEVNINDGYVTVQHLTTSGEQTTTHSGSAATAGTRQSAYYSMPVTGGTNYTFKYTTDHADTQMFAFFYNADGGCTHADSNFGIYNFTVNNGTGQATFKAPDGSAYVEIRFDNNTPATKAKFWDIMVYDADRAAEIDLENWPTRPYRVVYNYDNQLTAATVPTPVRKGYRFDRWYLAGNGNDLSQYYNTGSTPYKFAASWVVYSDWTQKTLDIGYNNLFSLSDWAYSTSTEVAGGGAAGGVIECDLEAGTIKVTTGSGGEAFSSSNLGTGQYLVPVTAGETYILDYDATCQGAIQTFVFFYDADGSVTVPNTSNYFYNSYSTNTITFTVPAGATQVGFRFGTYGDAGNWAKYENIGLYKKADYDAYVSGYTEVREPFKYGDTDNLMTPSRTGYRFDGWFTADNKQITSVDGLYESDTVYAHWTKTHTVTFLNASGGTMHTATVVTGNALASNQYPAANPTKASDRTNSYTFSKWDYDGSVITSDITIKPVFTSKAHGNYKYTLVTEPGCETNALVKKVCGNCNYNFGNVTFDGDGAAYPEFVAKGHDFDGQPAVAGSYRTHEGKHQVLCSRYYTASCGGETYVDHSWNYVESTGATCSVKGTNHYSCACQATKTEEGVIAPSVHVNTEKVNYVAPTCLGAGKDYDTYCNDCDTTIATGDAIAALGHSFKTYKFDAGSATCTADGTETAKCERCDVTDTRTAAGTATGHDWEDKGTDLYSAADCDSDAVYYQTCKDCGISARNDTTKTGGTWTDKGTAWGHKYTSTVRDNNDGTHSYLCANGCKTYGFDGVENDSTACTYGAWDTSNDNTHSKTCSACKHVYTENHKWSAWKTVNGATDKAKAQHTRSCSTCGKVQTVDCTYKSVETKETCTEDGYTTHTCTTCSHVYVTAGTTKTGHSYTSGTYKHNSSSDVHQQLCANGCGTYGVGTEAGKWESCSWSYTNKADGTHTASCVCGNTQDEACTGGTATCTEPKTCEKCKKYYGDKAPHSFNGTPVALTGDVHAYRCTFCDDQTIYGVGAVQGDTQDCYGGTATCTDKAVCTVCGETHGQVNADNHSWTIKPVNVAGTETHTYTCAYNSTHTKTEACYSSTPAVAAPDCNTAGFTLNTCDFCDHTWKTDPTVALGHDWGDWVNNGDGTHTRTCKRGCGYSDKTQTSSCTKANADSVVTDPTCLEKGYTTYTCNDCGYVWKADYEDATGHSYTGKKQVKSDKYKRSDKDCVTALTYWYCCDNCDVSAGTEKDNYADETALYWVSEAATGHKFDRESTEAVIYLKAPATCTTSAVYYKSCSVCYLSSKGTDKEATFTFGAPLGHDWTDTEKYLKSASDCVNDEVYYKECSRCHISSKDENGATWIKTGTKKGHDFDHDNDGVIGNEGDAGYTAYKAPDCENNGVEKHYTCETCKKMYADEAATTEITNTVISKLGHDWVSVPYKAATCDEAGHNAHKDCSRCDATLDKTVYPATGHKFTGAYYCDTANNYHAKYCVNDDCTEYGIGTGENAVIYSAVYDGIDWVITGGEACVFDKYEASTDENGIHSHKLTCKCGNETSQTYTDDNPVTTAPNCTDEGYTLNTCPVCGDTWKTDIVASLGHDLSGKATSNGDGTHSVKCARENCDYEDSAADCSTQTPATTCGTKNECDICGGEFGEAIEHVFTDYKYNNDATCTDDGTKTAECDNCDTNATHTVTATGTKLGHSMVTFDDADARKYKSAGEWKYDNEYGYNLDAWKGIPADFNKASIHRPTCSEEGVAISYCTREGCAHYLTKKAERDTEAHNWGEEEYIGGNCSTGVTYRRTCSLCGETSSRVENNVPHTWKIKVAESATCEAPSTEYYVCEVCGYTKEEHKDAALGHSYDAYPAKTATVDDIANIASAEYVIDKEVTCGQNGRMHYVCTRCKGNSDYVEITKINHVWDMNGDGLTDEGFTPDMLEYDDGLYVEASEATCQYEGHAGYYKCFKCSYDQHLDSRWKNNIIAKKDHNDGDGNGKCDSCNTKLYETDDGSSKNCDCICHKDNSFMKIIYKILCFFWRLFGIGKSCDCGNIHY